MSGDHGPLTTVHTEREREGRGVPDPLFQSSFSVSLSLHGPFSKVRIKPGKEDERRRRRRSADGEFNAAAIPCIN